MLPTPTAEGQGASLTTQSPPTRASSGPLSYNLPTSDGLWVASDSQIGRKPSGPATVRIQDVGTFEFDSGLVTTVRPDIFQSGHYAMFDVLLHLPRQGDIVLQHHLDQEMDTHIVDTINDKPGWWYQTYYAGGWPERNVLPMDMYPYKPSTHLTFYRENESRLAALLQVLRDEAARLKANNGQVILPEVTIRSPAKSWQFRDVAVRSHHVRPDLFQPGHVTALDIILSLGEQGHFSKAKLTWYDRIGRADPVDSFWLEQLDEAIAHGGCGFVYETGPKEFSGFAGSHIHLPMDARLIGSPEYALWFWICL